MCLNTLGQKGWSALPARDFPEGFLFGAATSSHQVEGGNDNCDWWDWELAGGAKDLSGTACEHYERYPEDIALLRSLGLNSYRFSLEWSRIEPEPGRFETRELEHYRDMALACRAQGVEPIVTLHHFTLPRWLSEKGGVLAPGSTERFAAFCGAAADALEGAARYIITINEPMILVLMGYVDGVWPPGRKSYPAAVAAAQRLVRWHRAAYDRIRARHPDMLLGIAKHWIDFQPLDKGSAAHRRGAALQHYLFNRWYLRAIRRSQDFIGLNYYSTRYVTSLTQGVPLASEDEPRTEMGWSISPQGLTRALRGLREFRLPIMVTENGIAAKDDGQRLAYLLDHLAAVRAAMREGIPVVGYQYWSLLDNFEWAEGYRPQFGLVHIDRDTQARTVRPSGERYGEIARTGRLAEPGGS